MNYPNNLLKTITKVIIKNGMEEITLDTFLHK